MHGFLAPLLINDDVRDGPALSRFRAVDPRLDRLLHFITETDRDEERVIDLLIRDSTANILICARCGLDWLHRGAHSHHASPGHASVIGR